ADRSMASELRPLEGDKLVEHVARFGAVQFNGASSNPFTLAIAADGKTERICKTCKKPSITGTMTVKADQSLICFQWKEGGYPDSGCFQVLPRGSGAFEMHGTEGERAIRYTMAQGCCAPDPPARAVIRTASGSRGRTSSSQSSRTPRGTWRGRCGSLCSRRAPTRRRRAAAGRRTAAEYRRRRCSTP